MSLINTLFTVIGAIFSGVSATVAVILYKELKTSKQRKKVAKIIESL